MLPLILTLIASPTVDLAGEWRIAAGDDPAFAKIAFDDRDWATIEVPDRGSHPVRDAQRTVWYRKRVRVPQAWSTSTIAISLGPSPLSALDVYVDDQLVGRAGDGDTDSIPPPRFVAYDVPSEVFADGEVVIAVRSIAWTRSGGVFSSNRLTGRRPVIGERSAVLDRVERSRAESLLRLSVHPWVIALISLLLGLYHLHLWVRRRSMAGYFWYGVSLVFGTALDTTQGVFFAGWIDSFDMTIFARVYQASYQLYAVLLLQFLLAFLGSPTRSNRPWRAMQLFHLTAAIGSATIVLGIEYAFIAIAGWVAVFVFALLSAIRKKHPYAWYVLAGCVLMAVSANVITASSVPYLGTYASLFLNIAMALALSRHFNDTLDDLDGTNRAIRRFVPFTFLDLLGKPDVRHLERGDQRAVEVAVLFADLRGFTTLAERLGPERTFAFINDYLAAMEEPIHAAGGVINDVYGDGIMALFPESPARAVEAARGMQSSLRSLRTEEPLQMGIGIHTGPLMMGAVGGTERLSCTVVGDPANLASRIQELTKVYDAPILVSQAVVDAGIPAEPVASDVTIRGRASSVTLYAPS